MPTPFRLEVLERLTTALEEITPANGYEHDLSGKVFRGRTVFGDNDPLPMVSILEVPQPKDQLDPPTGGAVYKGPWELVIQGFCQDDRDNPSDPAYHLEADVRKRLAGLMQEAQGPGRGRVLGPWAKGGVLGMMASPPVVRPPDEVSSKAYFWLTITLNVVDDLGSPFTY